MDKTPVMSKSRLSCRRTNLAGPSVENESKENSNNFSSTSCLEARLFDADDESPVHIACTQEGCENVDVVWDWNSPQATRKPKKAQKRLILHSPKIPLKRHPSNNQIQDFEKLREELQSLREQIALPDNEDNLVLSPLDEAEYKDISNVLDKSTIPQDNYPAPDEDDVFNDSVDEQLLLFSQKIEAELNTVGHTNRLSTNNISNQSEVKDARVQNTNKKQKCDISSVKTNNFGVHSRESEIVNIANGFFDTMLQDVKMESRVEEVTKFVNKTNLQQDTQNNNHRFPRNSSLNPRLNHCTTSKEMKFPRTHSFESTLDNKDIIPPSKLAEIERKRKEALAKLELKRKKETSESVTKCTPQEIERKRLLAIAKREAKRQQDIIERNRQEALKRLELSRRKNGTIVNNSVTRS